jgi:hypothetical protein
VSDRTEGSDDMRAEEAEHREDDARERWHERHAAPEDWADVCWICEEEMKEENDG